MFTILAILESNAIRRNSQEFYFFNPHIMFFFTVLRIFITLVINTFCANFAAKNQINQSKLR